MARRRNRRGQFTKHAHGTARRTRRRHSTRRNPIITRRAARRRSYRASVRRNPGIARGLFGMMPPISRIAAGAVGAMSTRLIPGLAARYIGPQVPTTGAAGLGVKALAALLLGMVGHKTMGRQVGEDIAFGGFITVLDEAARTWVYPQIPGLPMAAYMDPSLSAYLDSGMSYANPGMVLPGRSPGLSAYSTADEDVEEGVSRLDPSMRF